jgi:nitronate monooxygenase
MTLRTRLSDRLGIEYPIVLAPMGQVSEVSLAAAVSNGGGLGTFGAAGRVLGLTEQYVRDTIAALRDRTDKPFGAGFITQLIAENPANLDIVLEAEVPVVLFSFADPTKYVALAKQTSTTTICQVHSFEAAQVAADAGTDVIAVQGNEAGGHTGRQNLIPFLCRVLDAFPDIPVIAAGGITNGRALAAVLAAGADGAWMGTAFLAATEAAAVPPAHLNALLASDGTDTVFSEVFDIVMAAGFRGPEWPEGVGFRTRRFALVDQWHGREADLRAELDAILPAFRTGMRSVDPDYSPVPYGEGAGSVTSQRPAAEIIRAIARDAEGRLPRT